MTSSYRLCVYSGGSESISEVLEKVKFTFGIDLKNYNIEIVHLGRVKYIEAQKYPVATLFFQFLGSIFLFHEALSKLSPSIIIDTHGQPFGYFLAYFSGIKVVAYVHYPLISTDMISRVREMRPSFNNSNAITSNSRLSSLKLIYYYILLTWYKSVGLFCDLALCNSSWTHGHISKLWGKAVVLYPPCDVSSFLNIPLERKLENIAISIGQFRPEKDHNLQILAFAILVKYYPKAKLLLVGSCRNQEDLDRVEELKNVAKKENIEGNVEFHVNVKYDELMRLLSRALIGLHSMWNEHFGICVVELMASGVATIANNSAGPKLDIISNGIDGFLASTPEEYAETMRNVIMNYERSLEIRKSGREKAKRFSQELFSRDLQGYLEKYFN